MLQEAACVGPASADMRCGRYPGSGHPGAGDSPAAKHRGVDVKAPAEAGLGRSSRFEGGGRCNPRRDLARRDAVMSAWRVGGALRDGLLPAGMRSTGRTRKAPFQGMWCYLKSSF